MTSTAKLVDIDFALSQLSGNSDLLSKMLIKFSDEFKFVPSKVIQALAQNDIPEAKIQVHTTKGLSGNLGLMALYECSKILDQQIRNGNVDDSTTKDFAEIMEKTCIYIKSVNLKTKEPQSFSNESVVKSAHNSADKDTSTSNVEKNKFLVRLQNNEFIDDDTLFTCVNALALTEDQKLTIKELVEELQYAKAIDLIKQFT